MAARGRLSRVGLRPGPCRRRPMMRRTRGPLLHALCATCRRTGSAGVALVGPTVTGLTGCTDRPRLAAGLLQPSPGGFWMKHLTVLALAAAFAVGSAACSDSPSSPSLSGGNFNLRMRDTPFSDAKAVLVTFSSVRAHRSDSDWTVVPFVNAATTRTCDLENLETSEDVLGSAA